MAENKNLNTYTCPGCGAMLDPGEADKARGIITCRYCKARVQLKKNDETNTAGLPFTGRNRRPGKFLMAFLVLALVGVALISAVIFFLSKGVSRKTMDNPAAGRFPEGTIQINAETQSSFPISCKGEKSIAIVNQSFTRDGIILDTGGPCRVFIDNTTLISKDRPVKITGTGTVTIDNSNLTGGSCALWVSDRVTVVISNSNINSDGTAIHAMGNASVTIRNCNLTGSVAARAGDRAKIVIANTNVKGETKGNIEVQ
ncbi:MAG: right-handed parallel beta-helix repeat-containing protein [Spirochaetes bacterium]|nr:right-handed parallel beta-helix repeat-containing protein [Spirochaetota bacterium]